MLNGTDKVPDLMVLTSESEKTNNNHHKKITSANANAIQRG